jgi:hypothetical protein
MMPHDPLSSRLFWLLAASLLVSGLGFKPALARAQTSHPDRGAKTWIDKGGGLNVLADGRAMPHDRPHLGVGLIPTGRYFEWKVRLSDEDAVNYFLGFTPQLQLGSRSGKFHVNSELDFIGNWTPFDSRKMTGELQWWFRWNQTYTTLNTEQFADSQFLTIKPNDGDTGTRKSNLAAALLSWGHYFVGRVGYRIGQLNAQTLYGVNEFLSNDRTDFMALPLAGPFGTAFMEKPIGLGLQIGAWNDLVYGTAGLQEATANQEYPDFSSLARWEMAYFAEFGLTPGFGTALEGAYRVTYSYIGRTGAGPSEGPGHSVVVTASQRIHDRWGLFGRYTQAFRRLPQDDFRLAVVAGFVRLGPFGFSSDRVGLAYIFDKPSDGALRNEHGIEVYWRFQLTQLFSVTPDLQVYFTPSKAMDDDFSVIGGLRLQLAI